MQAGRLERAVKALHGALALFPDGDHVLHRVSFVRPNRTGCGKKGEPINSTIRAQRDKTCQNKKDPGAARSACVRIPRTNAYASMPVLCKPVLGPGRRQNERICRSAGPPGWCLRSLSRVFLFIASSLLSMPRTAGRPKNCTHLVGKLNDVQATVRRSEDALGRRHALAAQLVLLRLAVLTARRGLGRRIWCGAWCGRARVARCSADARRIAAARLARAQALLLAQGALHGPRAARPDAPTAARLHRPGKTMRGRSKAEKR